MVRIPQKKRKFTLYNIRPRNGSDLFLQPQGPQGAGYKTSVWSNLAKGHIAAAQLCVVPKSLLDTFVQKAVWYFKR